MIPPIRHEHGIVTLDADYLRPGLAAIHLMLQDGGAAIVDTGTNQAVPRVLAELKGLSIEREAVDYVIVTHVHLDHAGAAGALLRDCPNARLVVHPKGARHMIDPARLVAGSIDVYGRESFFALYGDIVPVPAERVIEAGDGFRLDFRGRTLTFLDTPGHARHHFCIHDSRSDSLFTGDTFGLSYREFDVGGDENPRPFVFPTTTPVQFEPDALHASVDRLVATGARAAFLTHYGRIEGLPGIAPALHDMIDEFVALARAAPGEGQHRHERLKAAVESMLMRRLRAHGCSLDDATCRALLANDVELNTQGLLVWRDRG
jgi:glyoxylase-like metal-dependent hydrolase (beta-lactamase superfamily II)